MTDAYAHTISGLLQRRKELQTEAADIRERAARIANDVSALDRVLTSLGYVGTLPNGSQAKPSRIVLFHRGELRRFLMAELQAADRPLATRELAVRLCAVEGNAVEDRRLVLDVTKRASKTLRDMLTAGVVQQEGQAKLWTLAR